MKLSNILKQPRDQMKYPQVDTRASSFNDWGAIWHGSEQYLKEIVRSE